MNAKQITERACAYFVALGLLAYGVGKTVQFAGANQVATPVAELTGMQLMWAFYGYSRGFVLLLGALELTAAGLLLFRPTRLLACLLASTILVNVILQDVFYGVHAGALVAALLYQIALLVILWLNRAAVAAAVGALTRLPRNAGGAWGYVLAAGGCLLLHLLAYWITHGV